MYKEIRKIIESQDPEEYLIRIKKSTVKSLNIEKEENTFSDKYSEEIRIFFRKNGRESIFNFPLGKFEESFKKAMTDFDYLPETEKVKTIKKPAKGIRNIGFQYDFSDLKRIGQEVYEEIKEYDMDTFVIDTSEIEYTIMHENDMEYTIRDLSTSASCWFSVDKFNTKLGRGFFHPSILPNTNLLKDIQEIKNDLEKLQKIEEILPSDNYDVIFIEDYSKDIILEVLSAISSSQMFYSSSVFKDKLNKKIANSSITIVENPHLPNSVIDFDYYGHEKFLNPIIEEGILKRFIVDEFLGNKIGLKSTANSGFLTHNISNIVIHNLKSYTEHIRNFTGIKVTTCLCFNFEPVTGNFSSSIEGERYQNGKLIGAFANAVISINIFDLLDKITFLDDIKKNTNVIVGSCFLKNVFISGKN